MKNNNYITILGWMINELSLSGNDLICYALIYGFSQDDNYWDGSLSYLSEWLGVSKRRAIDILKRLVSNGHIVKQEYEVNNVKLCKYKAVVPNFTGGDETSPGGSDETSHDNKSNIYKEERDKSLSKKDELFEECWIAYRRKGKKGKAKTYWDKLKEDEMGKVLQHIKSYVSVNELRYQQDFERYLRDKTFESIVVKGNIIVYDPTLGEDATYHPFGNNNIMWNDLYNCWLSIDDFNGSVIDGYNDENRPDGAEIVLHNARGTITWSKKNKKWNIEMKSPW